MLRSLLLLPLLLLLVGCSPARLNRHLNHLPPPPPLAPLPKKAVTPKPKVHKPVAALPAAAPNAKVNNHKKHKKHSGKKQRYDKKQRQHVQHYYRSLPPGLYKKRARGGKLPRGWQKRIAIGRTLPADYLINAPLAPRDLLKEMPPLPAGSMMLHLEHQMILIDKHTRHILDIIKL